MTITIDTHSRKTQIVIDFALSVQSQVSIYWVRADSRPNFVEDYSRILPYISNTKKRRTGPGKDPFETVKVVTKELQKKPRSWLLILDNADDWNIFTTSQHGDFGIADYLPEYGRILLTSRDPRFVGTIASAESGERVLPMDKNEAMQMLLLSIPRHLQGKETKDVAKDLLNELGNLPLAIAQAAANITDGQRTLQGYAEDYRLKKNRLSLMKVPVQMPGAQKTPQSIHITWELSIELLEREYPLAAALLNYLGFWHCQHIPSPLLKVLPEFKDLSNEDFRNILTKLLQLSMIDQVIADGWEELFVHPVLHERISARLNQQSAERALNYLTLGVEILASFFPARSQMRTMNDNSFLLCQYLQAHALTQADFGEELNLKTRAFARLLQVLALYLSKVGLTNHGQRLAAKSVLIGEEVWGEDDSSTFWVRLAQISTLNADAQYEAAYLRVCEYLDKLESARSADLLTENDYSILRTQYRFEQSQSLGLQNEAEKQKIYQETIEFYSDKPEERWTTLTLKHNIAYSLTNQLKLREALRINTEVLSEVSEKDIDDNVVEFDSYCSMITLRATILSYMRQMSAAEPELRITDAQDKEIQEIYTTVYRIYQERADIRDPHYLSAMNNVVSELQHQDNNVDAAKLLEAAFEALQDSALQLEGQILHTLATSIKLSLEILAALHTEGSHLGNLLQLTEAILDRYGPFLGRFISLTDFNLCGVTLQGIGYFAMAEQLHRRALQRLQAPPHYQRDEPIEEIIHYNIMLALARQDLICDARAYKEAFEEKIARAEAIFGDLDSRLERDKKDREIYEQAQTRKKKRKLHKDDTWWREHEEPLRRATKRYGPVDKDVRQYLCHRSQLNLGDRPQEFLLLWSRFLALSNSWERL